MCFQGRFVAGCPRPARPEGSGYALTMRRRRAITIVEILLVVVVLAMLLAVLLPGLAGARTRARTMLCGTRLQQLGVATAVYLNDWNTALPQMRGPLPPPEGGEDIIGALFGGKRGLLPMYGVDVYGPEQRPLNSYVRQDGQSRDADGRPVEMEAFRSPMDKGARETYLSHPDFQHTDSIYDLWGTSYAINDHDLNGDGFKTLIPPGGGKMPVIQDPTKTWMIGSHTIYNFQQDSDRGERWYAPKVAEANLLFVDGHVRLTVKIPDVICEVENTTWDYTFLPVPERWDTAPAMAGGPP